jgi:hypothetical protein
VLRHYIHQVLATFRQTATDLVMVVERRGSHRAPQLAATFDHMRFNARKFRSEFSGRCYTSLTEQKVA